MLDGGQIIVVSGLLIGLVYGSVGLLSGFCLLSGLRGWWADGDGRLVRTYALAIGVAIAAAQLLANFNGSAAASGFCQQLRERCGCAALSR